MQRLIGLWLTFLILVAGAITLGVALPPSNMLSYEIEREVYLYDLRTSVASPMYAINQDNTTTSVWSPGMRWRAYLYQGRNRYRLRITDTWGRLHSETEIILPMDTPVGIHIPYLLWSPDNETLAVGISVSSHEDAPNMDLLALIRLDGEQVYREVVRGRLERRITWSPDGAYLAELGRSFLRRGQTQSWVRIIHAGDGSTLQLQEPTQDFTFWSSRAQWNPTSEWISYEVRPRATNESHLFIGGVDGTLHNIHTEPRYLRNTTWQHNTIVLGTIDGQLLRYDIADSEPVELHNTGLSGPLLPLAALGDGILIIWDEHSEATSPSRLGLYRNGKRIELQYLGQSTPFVNITPSGQALISLQNDVSDRMKLYRLDGEALQVIPSIPGVAYVHESPDAQWIAYTTGVTRHDRNGRLTRTNTYAVFVSRADGSRLTPVSLPISDTIEDVIWYDPD